MSKQQKLQRFPNFCPKLVAKDDGMDGTPAENINSAKESIAKVLLYS